MGRQKPILDVAADTKPPAAAPADKLFGTITYPTGFIIRCYGPAAETDINVAKLIVMWQRDLDADKAVVFPAIIRVERC